MRDKDHTSREIILEKTCELFAEKGFSKTTIRDICKQADTYQVSVNYYFGSKENLFQEAFIHAYNCSGLYNHSEYFKNYPPEEKLKAIIRFSVELLFSEDKKGWYFKIVARCGDILNKEPFYSEFMKFNHFHSNLGKTILKEIFHDTISDQLIDYAFFNYISQIIVLNHRHFHDKDHFIKSSSDPEYLEELSTMMYTFIISGIKELINAKKFIGENY